ncbi:type II toxin-antitoxin system VapC family toxin [Halomicroarcula sp. F13]|uniref:Type II toxin-antitoxin system VapC family toxin n=1 Tax=Haloarcula rubra TaxID=2487747 RepID=A0AAW4PXK1_9EURY|nr:type II toxin-antitoxin system VapC family toxin [Halomicroarcula rubra]MBX0325389.1 type II toxin-antitoxin system VapC family toxin [Halomicroarcula rubra]
MTVLVDTGVLYADHDTDSARHTAASDALETVYDGEHGQPYVSEYVYDEAVTLTLKRSNSIEAAHRLGRRLRGTGSFPEVYEILHVSHALFTDGIDVFERYDDQNLSFTDSILVAQAEHHDIDAVLSFDDDFDGLVDRLDPTDL